MRVSTSPGDPSGTNRRPLQSLVRNGQQACWTSTRKLKKWQSYERDCCKPRSNCHCTNAIRKFHDTQFEIFRSRFGSAKPKDGATPISYDDVLKGGATDIGKRAAWLDVAAEIESFSSWSILQAHSSTVLTKQISKVYFDEKVKERKESRDYVMAFVPSVQRSAVDL